MRKACPDFLAGASGCFKHDPGTLECRATACYAWLMESVSQREMRNNSGELLRRVAEGESVLITNGGVPAAVMVPAGSDIRTRLTAAGRLRTGTGLDLEALPAPVRVPRSSEELLSEDRD